MYQVRDGKRVVPTCPECGCRLSVEVDDSLMHYPALDRSWRDAKGHNCSILGGWLTIKDNQWYHNYIEWKTITVPIAPKGLDNDASIV